MAAKKNVKVVAKEEIEAVVSELKVEEIVGKPVAKKSVKTEKAAKTNKEKKVSVTVPSMSNEELRKLFTENGCLAGSNAKADTVVYNQFGTQSRVLQQKRAYQLLLTNGHKATKSGIVETENDDAKRFSEWYEGLSEEDKKMVLGYSEMMNTKLSASEMPRERSVKLQSYDLLVSFIKYMATFTENKLA